MAALLVLMQTQTVVTDRNRVRRFLGLLHMDVFHQRLEQEHGESVILTAPTVPYTLHLADGHVERIQNPSKYPTNQKARRHASVCIPAG